MLLGKLSLGVPVNKVLEDIRSSNVESDSIKRIHLIEKKDIHNIKRDYNISYATKRHENDLISVNLWVKEMTAKGDESPIIYFKQQGNSDNNVQSFTKDDFCLIIMTQFQSELLLKFGNDKICIDGTHGLNGYNFQLYTIVVVDEFGNGYPVAFCFSNKSDTALYKHYFQCIKNVTGKITANVFMSDDEPAFYNAWNAVMGPAEKQLLCTWHVLRNWTKNLSKIQCNEKKTIVFKTLKALLYETNEHYFYIELQKVLDDLFNDTETEDFGKYFKMMYSCRVEKWAYFNRKHIGINTNMYLEALHKTIKYSYLDGKKCKRLDLSINALMSLVRDKSFERIIKIAKQKKTFKINQIIAAHKKSSEVTPNMISEIDGYWLVNSTTNNNVHYKVEKTNFSCSECVLSCVECQICVHTYKCSCMNNVIYFNICKHIHACAKQKNNILLPCKPAVTSTLTYELAVDNGFLQPKETQPKIDENTDNTREITNKLESILGMVNRTKLNDIDQKYIIKQCDKIISKLAKNTDLKNTSNVGRKRNIEPQARFFTTKRKRIEPPTLSSTESKHIRESLRNSFDETLFISTIPMFDHSYL